MCSPTLATQIGEPPRTPQKGVPVQASPRTWRPYVFTSPHMPGGSAQCRFAVVDLVQAHARILRDGLVYVWCHGCAQLQLLLPCDGVGELLSQIQSGGHPSGRVEVITGHH